MKTSKLYLVFLVVDVLAIAVFASCTNVIEEPISGAVFSENFIQVYIVPNGIECQQSAYSENLIGIKFDGKELTNFRASDKPEYEKYSSKYGDVDYNRWLVPFSNIVVGEELSLINVRSNKDFDDNHPAGSLLNDVIKLYAASPRDFIRNRYEENPIPFPNEFRGSILVYDRNHSYHPICKLLSELTKADLVLLHQYCCLYITKDLPTGEYIFSIEIKTVNNVILKSSVEYVVE